MAAHASFLDSPIELEAMMADVPSSTFSMASDAITSFALESASSDLLGIGRIAILLFVVLFAVFNWAGPLFLEGLKEELNEIDPNLWQEYQERLKPGQSMLTRFDLLKEINARIEQADKEFDEEGEALLKVLEEALGQKGVQNLSDFVDVAVKDGSFDIADLWKDLNEDLDDVDDGKADELSEEEAKKRLKEVSALLDQEDKESYNDDDVSREIVAILEGQKKDK